MLIVQQKRASPRRFRQPARKERVVYGLTANYTENLRRFFFPCPYFLEFHSLPPAPLSPPLNCPVGGLLHCGATRGAPLTSD